MRASFSSSTVFLDYYLTIVYVLVYFVMDGYCSTSEDQARSKRQCIPCQPRYINPCFIGQPILAPVGIPQYCNWQMPNSCPNQYFCHVGANPQTTCCCPQLSTDPCSQPLNIGQGVSQLRRWYYDAASTRCEQFVYGGTLGNQNNFVTQQACRQTCRPLENPCPFGEPPMSIDGMPQICASTLPGVCPMSFWCHIGFSTDTTVCCPGSGQQCSAPQSRGTGTMQQQQRWWFDPANQECVSFTYTGSKGNENNYLTKEACEATCPVWVNPCQAVVTKSQVPMCSPVNLAMCPAGSWCHIGDQASTNVCCPGAVSNVCGLPRVDGVGSAQLQRWYYDSVTRTCQPFYYRGLKGNQNNFLSQQACQTICPTWPDVCAQGMPLLSNNQAQTCGQLQPCPSGYWCHFGANTSTTVCCRSTGSLCNLPQVLGEGFSQLQRYYYDPLGRACRLFIYRGAKGNENNFLTEQDCRNNCPVWESVCSSMQQPFLEPSGSPQYCSPQQPCPVNYWCHIGSDRQYTMCCPSMGDPCQQPQSAGEGNQTTQRFAYDRSTHQCRPFMYNGVRGNQNNFLSASDCAATCPVYTNPCVTPEPLLDRLGIPVRCSATPMGPQQSSCPPGNWCHLGLDAETTMCCPGNCDPCNQQMFAGEGQNSLQRWYFNTNAGRCQQFTYRGLRGNCNNFFTREDCRRACPERNPCKPPDEPLRQNDAIVSCTPGLLSSCPPTHYCHAGADPTTTVCCPRRGSACDLPRDVGLGTDNLNRWYYSPEQDECFQFTYRGNAGNENNFVSRGECERACPGFRGICPHGRPLVVAGEPQTCSVETLCQQNYVCHVNTQQSVSVCCADPSYFCFLPVDVGRCTNSMTRYSYDPQTDTCKPFSWSGCGGNLNNFDTLERCTQICCNEPRRRSRRETFIDIVSGRPL